VAALLAGALWVSPGTAQELGGLVALGGSTPVAGAVVELHQVSGETGALVDSTTTDASGGFTFFLQSDVDPGAVFLAGARYGGVLYWGPPVHSTNSADLEDYVVTVFDTMAVSAPAVDLRTSIRHVVITPTGEGLHVEEIIDVEGMPGRTLVSEADSVLVWRAMLARGALGIVPSPGGVPAEDVVLGDSSVGFRGALPPSGIRVVLQYFLSSSEYALELDHPTARLELLVMPQPGLDLRVSGLEETSVAPGMRIPVRRFSGTDLTAGSSVAVDATIDQPGRGRAGIWLLIAVLLGAAALASIRFTSRGASSGF
jgi:hypothetical protein